MVIQWEEPETPNGQVIVSARQTSTTSTRPAKRSTVRRPVLRSSMCDVLETTKSANRPPRVVQTFKSAIKKKYRYLPTLILTNRVLFFII